MKTFTFGKISPARDWEIVSCLFALCFIALSLLAWNIYLSKEIGGGYLDIETTPSAVVAKTIDQKRLRADLLLLENRQAAFLKAKAGGSKSIDPSL